MSPLWQRSAGSLAWPLRWVSSRTHDPLCAMNPPCKSVFRCEPLEQLTHQLLFSPPDRRRLQVLRAECLHDEIDPIANYPLDYIAYRLTGYRSESGESVLLVGDAVLPDLRHMIDTLSRSIDLARKRLTAGGLWGSVGAGCGQLMPDRTSGSHAVPSTDSRQAMNPRSSLQQNSPQCWNLNVGDGSTGHGGFGSNGPI